METPLDFNEKALGLVKERMKQLKLSQAELARQLNVNQTSVLHMLESKRMPVERLRKLSVVLEYNFFTALSDQLDLREPAKQLLGETEHKACNERIHELEIENRTLLKVLQSGK